MSSLHISLPWIITFVILLFAFITFCTIGLIYGYRQFKYQCDQSLNRPHSNAENVPYYSNASFNNIQQVSTILSATRDSRIQENGYTMLSLQENLNRQIDDERPPSYCTATYNRS